MKVVYFAETFVPTYKTTRFQNEYIPSTVWMTLLLIKDKQWKEVFNLILLFANFVCLLEYGN